MYRLGIMNDDRHWTPLTSSDRQCSQLNLTQSVDITENPYI